MGKILSMHDLKKETPSGNRVLLHLRSELHTDSRPRRATPELQGIFKAVPTSSLIVLEVRNMNKGKALWKAALSGLTDISVSLGAGSHIQCEVRECVISVPKMLRFIYVQERFVPGVPQHNAVRVSGG